MGTDDLPTRTEKPVEEAAPTGNLQSIRSFLIRWIAGNLPQFDLSRAEDEEHALELLKPIGELVLTCDILSRFPGTERIANTWLHWSWSQFRQGQLIHDVLLSRPDLVIISSIYASFHVNGFQHQGTVEWLKYLSRTRFVDAIQYPNWRRLDYEHAMERLGFLGMEAESIERMWSAKLPEPWLIESDAAYALTHEVFYVTDFGAKSQRLPSLARDFISAWLPAWINIFRRRDDWDLVSELLIVHASIGGSPDVVVPVFDGMAEVVEAKTYLPSPLGGGSKLFRPSDDEPRRLFLSNYHTTLVGLIAASIAS